MRSGWSKARVEGEPLSHRRSDEVGRLAIVKSREGRAFRTRS